MIPLLMSNLIFENDDSCSDCLNTIRHDPQTDKVCTESYMTANNTEYYGCLVNSYNNNDL